MSLPDLAEEIEDTPKYRYGLAAICLFAGFVGFSFDVLQRHDSDQVNRQLLQDAKRTLSENDALITSFSLLTPRINTLNNQVEEINHKMGEAKGNPALLANLQRRLDATEKEKAVVSKQLLTQLVPTIITQMRDRSIALQNTTMPDDLRYYSPEQIESFRAGYRKSMIPILQNAEYLRQQLLQGEQATPEDAAQGAMLKSAINGDFSSFSEGSLRNYLQNLAARFSSPNH